LFAGGFGVGAFSEELLSPSGGGVLSVPVLLGSVVGGGGVVSGGAMADAELPLPLAVHAFCNSLYLFCVVRSPLRPLPVAVLYASINASAARGSSTEYG
jgi:hypothetical protein